MTLGEPRLEPSTGPRLRVEVELPPPPAAARVLLEGELDGEEVPRLRQALAHVPAGRDIEVDAGTLTFLDSAGIRELVLVRERLLDEGARIVIRAVTDNVLRVLEISALVDAFAIGGPV